MKSFYSRVVVLSLVAAAALVAGPQAAVAAGQGVDKQTICHIPPGNPENPRTIEVAAPSVQAHLDHGDSIGACDAAQATVSGGVFDFATQQPVAGASVTLTFVDTGSHSTTETDENGLFVFEGVPVAGAFIVEASRVPPWVAPRVQSRPATLMPPC